MRQVLMTGRALSTWRTRILSVSSLITLPRRSAVLTSSISRLSRTIRPGIQAARSRSVMSSAPSESFVSAMDSAPAGLVVCEPTASIANPAELRNALARRGLQPPLAGWSPAADLKNSGRQLVAVVTGKSIPPLGPAREDFRVVAFLPTYNESDIISHTLQYLTGQGIQVYLIDNWSTDDTLARARRFSGRGLIGMERFPSDGPVATYEWRQILGRVEDIAEQLDADWFVLHDADERRHTPWPGVDLRTGLHHVDRCGFTCVDHVVANFWPTGETFDPARDVEGQLRYFSFSDHPGHYHQRKAWKNCGCRVSLAASAGHDVCFPGRRVYPFKFLLKHYPIRSEEHGRRKVLGIARRGGILTSARSDGTVNTRMSSRRTRSCGTLPRCNSSRKRILPSSTSSSGCRPSASSTPDQLGPPDLVTRVEWVRADRSLIVDGLKTTAGGSPPIECRRSRR